MGSILKVQLSELNFDSVLLYLYDEEALYFTGHKDDNIMLHNVKLRNVNRHIYLEYKAGSAYFLNDWWVRCLPKNMRSLWIFNIQNQEPIEIYPLI
jgi:hypothetical protein